MDNIKGVSINNPLNYSAPSSHKLISAQNNFFEQQLSKTHNISHPNASSGVNPLSIIPTDIFPMNDSKMKVTGSQITFLGAFHNHSEASVSRTENSIHIKSPIINMKIERMDSNPDLVYFEMPQGNLTGKITINDSNDSIAIESSDRKKCVYINIDDNGDMRVTNKGIQENIKLTFKKPE